MVWVTLRLDTSIRGEMCRWLIRSGPNSHGDQFMSICNKTQGIKESISFSKGLSYTYDDYSLPGLRI